MTTTISTKPTPPPARVPPGSGIREPPDPMPPPMPPPPPPRPLSRIRLVSSLALGLNLIVDSSVGLGRIVWSSGQVGAGRGRGRPYTIQPHDQCPMTRGPSRGAAADARRLLPGGS